jgi:hypothetical protein
LWSPASRATTEAMASRSRPTPSLIDDLLGLERGNEPAARELQKYQRNCSVFWRDHDIVRD